MNDTIIKGNQPNINPSINLWLDRAGFLFLLLVPIMMAVARGPADVAASMVALLFLIRSIINRDFSWVHHLWVKAFFLFWAYMVLRGFFADDWQSSTSSAFVFLRYGMFAFAICFWLLRDDRHVKALFISLFLATMFLTIDGIVQYITGTNLFGKPPFSGHRISGPFNRPILGNILMPMALLLLFPLINRVKGWDQSMIFGLVAILPFFVILLSGDRSPTLLAGFAGLIIFLCADREIKKKFIPFIGFGIAGLITVLATQPKIFQRQVDSVIEALFGASQFSYIPPFLDGWTMFLENPIFGVGFKQFSTICNSPDFIPTTTCFSHPHNFYIQNAAELGIVGLILFIVMVGCFFIPFMKSWPQWRNQPLLLGALAVMIARFWPIIGSGNFNASWVALGLWMAVGIAFHQLYKMDKS